MHGLDPEAYFRDLIRVLPFWPCGRYLELCLRDWPATRAKLDPQQLAAEVGWLDVPRRLALTAANQGAPRSARCAS